MLKRERALLPRPRFYSKCPDAKGLPRDVYGICITYKNFKDLKTFLIELFPNPKMTEVVPGTASATGDPSVFTIGQHMENNVVSPTAADVSKICQDTNALQVRFNKIT